MWCECCFSLSVAEVIVYHMQYVISLKINWEILKILLLMRYVQETSPLYLLNLLTYFLQRPWCKSSHHDCCNLLNSCLCQGDASRLQLVQKQSPCNINFNIISRPCFKSLKAWSHQYFKWQNVMVKSIHANPIAAIRFPRGTEVNLDQFMAPSWTWSHTQICTLTNSKPSWCWPLKKRELESPKLRKVVASSFFVRPSIFI